MLKARGHESGLLEEVEPKQAATLIEVATADREFEDLIAEIPRPAHVEEQIQKVQERDAELTFADRLQIAQYLDDHGVFEVASDLLVGRLRLDIDTVGASNLPLFKCRRTAYGADAGGS